MPGKLIRRIGRTATSIVLQGTSCATITARSRFRAQGSARPRCNRVLWILQRQHKSRRAQLGADTAALRFAGTQNVSQINLALNFRPLYALSTPGGKLSTFRGLLSRCPQQLVAAHNRSLKRDSLCRWQRASDLEVATYPPQRRADRGLGQAFARVLQAPSPANDRG